MMNNPVTVSLKFDNNGSTMVGLSGISLIVNLADGRELTKPIRVEKGELSVGALHAWLDMQVGPNVITTAECRQAKQQLERMWQYVIMPMITSLGADQLHALTQHIDRVLREPSIDQAIRQAEPTTDDEAEARMRQELGH